MSSTIYYTNLQRLLFLYADLVEQSNSLGLSNETVNAENLFAVFLNKAFGWKLINANQYKINQDSFDLIDNRNGIAIQVTSNKKHTSKFNQTISGFKQNRKNKKIKHLIVLFISKKCPANILKKIKSNGFLYEAYDIPKLLNEVYFKNKLPSQLKALNQIFFDATSPVLINSSFPVIESPVNENILPAQSVSLKGKGFYINRKELIENVFAFGQVANGLLIGGPGVGKSFTIEELQRLCHKKKIPCFIIRINELLTGSDKELKRELKTNIHWINALKKVSLADTSLKALLIFDAFDTAKDETLKSSILKQIRSAINELSGKWNVLVSVRTFDAAKSTRLLELFPQINIARSVSCHYFEIPELSDQEVTNTIKKNKKLYTVVQKCTPELKAFLKVPYFLKLLENIINDSGWFKSSDLIHIETEEQLLEIFWNKKVAGDIEKDFFLKALVQKLTEKENLSCDKSSVLTESNLSIFDHLISLRILTESSVTKQNISFSHNILLEFAISKYLIPEDVDSLITYINTRQKVPFFFRQSFIYFYSKIWKLENPLFWKHYFQIRNNNTPLFRLFHQTILNYILAGYYVSTKELSPIFELQNQQERGQTIKKILEGIRFIRKGKLIERDFALLLKASQFIDEPFLWELGFLIAKAIKVAIEGPVKNELPKLSKASVNYLKFVLENRKLSSNKDLIEVNGGMWGIQNLCATFSANKHTSAKLVRKVLEVLKEPDFPIRFFYILSDNLLLLFKNDEKLALEIYKTLYYHNETSDKETLLGNSVIMALRSNREQDFESIHHKLERDYNELLSLSPIFAIPLGLGIVNKFSIDKTHYRAIEKPFKLNVNGINAKLTSDFSFYDSEHDKDYGPISHAENIFKFLEELLNKNETTKAAGLIKLVIQNAEASMIWRKLISLFKHYPKQLKKEAFGLLMNVPIFICNETVHEAGELIKVLWPILSISQKKKLEQTILSIASSKLLKRDIDLGERRINRLLSCIPANELRQKDSIAIVETKGQKENTPILSRPTLMPHQSTRDEKIANLGIDPTDNFQLDIYEIIEKLEPFNSIYDYNNKDKPPKTEFSPLLPLAKKLFGINQAYNFSNSKLKFSCDYEVSRFAKLLARHGSGLNKSLRNFVQEVALYYLNSPDYKAVEYEIGDIKNRWGAYSPTPRTAATQMVVHLLFSDKSKTLAPLLLELISDNTQIVRFKSLNAFTHYWHFYRTEFWNKVYERCLIEKDGMCLHQVIHSIYYDNIIKENQKETEAAATILIKSLKGADDEAAHELWHIYVILILKLIIKFDSKIALEIVYSNLSIKAFSRGLLFEMLTVLDPHSNDNNYVTNPGKYNILLEIMQAIVAFRFKSIEQKGLQSNNIRDDFEIIDYSIQHLYFTIVNGKKTNKGKKILPANKAAFFSKIKPFLSFITDESAKIGSGFMVAHTGYYFMQLLNNMLDIDAEYILILSSSIVKYAAAAGFTYDQSTLGEIVKFTEKILADHKELLSKKENFESLITILDLFANSGWQEALELTWRLKEVF